MNATITKNIYWIPLLTVIILSCVKPVDDFDLKDSKHKIVVNGVLDPDSIFKLQIVSSVGALEVEKLKYIENANVGVYENNNLLFTLDEYSEGLYSNSEQHPEYGKTYKIMVDANGFESVNILVPIPQKIQVLKLDTSTVIEINQQVNSGDEFKIEAIVMNNDVKSEYYIIEVKSGNWFFNYDYSNVQGPWDEPELLDSSYIFGNKWLYTKDIGAELSLNSNYIENYEGWTGDYDKSGEALLYSDRLLGRKNPVMKVGVGINDNYYYSVEEVAMTIDVILSEVNEDFYYYIKALSNYSDDPFDKFFNESITLYTNVENGMGLVFGKSSYKKSFELTLKRE